MSLLNPNSSEVLVAAHRAAHSEVPENSIPAIIRAIELGVDIVELDVKVTKDGIPVLMHDRTIDRTTTGSGLPSDFTLKELKSLVLLHNGETTYERIPSLSEALEVTKGRIWIDIDLKTDQLDPIMDVIKAYGCEDQVFYFDSDYDALHYIERRDAASFIMPRAYSLEMADSAVAVFDPEIVHIDFSFYDGEVVNLIKRNNSRVWINALGEPDRALGTSNEEKIVDRLLEFGANVIQTDEPEALLQALRRRGLHR